MKCIEVLRRAGLVPLVALTLVLAACGAGSSGDVGGSDAAGEATATAPPATPTSETSAEESDTAVDDAAADGEPSDDDAGTAGPATEPSPEPFEASDDERISAALAALDREGLDGLIAWDILDTSVDDNGLVRFTLCVWSGETPADEVIESRWTTTTDNATRTITATNAGKNITTGDCLNTELINSALAFIRSYESWISTASTDENVLSDLRNMNAFVTEEFRVSALAQVQSWWDDGLEVKPAAENGVLPDGVLRPMLWSQHDGGLHLVACESMNSDYGVYRAGVRIDDLKPDAPAGTDVVTAYTLVRQREPASRWLVDGADSLVWSDCFSIDDFSGAVANWLGGGQ